MQTSTLTLVGSCALAALVGATAIGMLPAPDTANAQGWQSKVTSPEPRAKGPPATPTQPLQMQTQYLVRTTLLALNDANRTGNYTVLRDLAAPSFRERNSAADLATVFAQLRRARLDLSVAAIMTPELDGPPTLDAERRLLLKGTFPTEPNRIAFEIKFEAVEGQWHLFALTISTRPSRTAAGGCVAPSRPQ